MSSKKPSTNQKKNKSDFFNIFGEVLGWLQIVISPLLIAAIIGFLVYISKPNITRLIIGIAITAIGLIVGIIWATKAWKGKGTIHFISTSMATPELDRQSEESK